MFSLGQPREFQPAGRCRAPARRSRRRGRSTRAPRRAGTSRPRPAPAVAEQVVVALAHPRRHARVQLERDGGRRHRHRHAGLVEDPGQPPHAGAAAVLVVRLGARVALRRLHAGVGVLAPAVVAVVAPQHRVLGALLVDQHEVDDHLRAVRPLERRRRAAVADQVAGADCVRGSSVIVRGPSYWQPLLQRRAVTRSATLPAIAWQTGQWASASAISVRTCSSGAGDATRVWSVGVGQVVVRPVAPGERASDTAVSISPSGISRARAMPVSVEVKQLASAAENSSSGLDSPPGPPSSACVAVATTSDPDVALDPAVEAVPAQRCRGVRASPVASQSIRTRLPPC